MARVDDIKDRVLAHQFSSVRYADAAIDEINKGHKHVVRKAEFRTGMQAYDFPTVASTAAYSLPSDFMVISSIFNTDSRSAVGTITQDQYDDLDSTLGTPTFYVITEGDMYFYPTPDAVYNMRLRYRMSPTDIGAGDDPITPAEYDDVIVDYACWKLYQMEHDFEAAQYHKDQMDEGLINMRTDLNFDATDDPIIIPGTWG